MGNQFPTGSVVFGDGYKDMGRFFVGFDEQFDRMSKLQNEVSKNVPGYPPYNIKKTGETTYQIELAVAGFDRSDIEIELVESKLSIRGNAAEDSTSEFVFRGIANRAFTRTFALDDQIEVRDAEMVNGMLRVLLERVIPEHKKPRRIEVKNTSEKLLLVEETA